MNWLDFTLVGGYVLFLIGLAYYFSLRQQSQEDYYLGGRTIPWWASGLSTMATQLGTISFVSAPAFVALKDVGTGGGLGWLTYEFGVPLALVFIMIFLLPGNVGDTSGLHRGESLMFRPLADLNERLHSVFTHAVESGQGSTSGYGQRVAELFTGCAQVQGPSS